MTGFHEYQEIPFNSSNYFETCWIKTNQNKLNLTFDIFLPEPQASIVAFVVAIQSIAGIVLNFLVIASLLRNPQLRKAYLTPSIVSIAITDWVFSILLVFYSIYFAIRDMVLPTGCQPFVHVFYALWLCSALNLLGIAALRCLVVYFPGKAQDKEFHQASKIIPILAWIVGFLWLLPTSIGKYGQFGLDCRSLACYFINQDFDGSKSNPENTFALGIMGIGFFILLLSILTYSRVKAHTRAVLANIEIAVEEATQKIMEKERKLGNMVTLMIVSYFMVYLPAVFMHVSDPDIATNNPNVACFGFVLAFSLVVVDPLVYIIFNQLYRDEVKALTKDAISMLKMLLRQEIKLYIKQIKLTKPK